MKKGFQSPARSQPLKGQEIASEPTARPQSHAPEKTHLRRTSGAGSGGSGRVRAAAARLRARSGRVAGQLRLQAGIWGYPAGSRKEDARWDSGGRSAGTPGRAAMNLERLRKRVRQYLDQVGDPTRGAGATGFASYPFARKGNCHPGLGGAWPVRAWAFVPQ